ncbi:SGNH/GDSL hydrolase family protein [Propionibacteriaceae bacterium Y1700]|uniref:SGNH/GDSL hydrolase family protein n=1 Tax=Microlunatus sp. Y1700 TaxID=3418487 RepID=UPI003DA72F69
MSEQQPSMPVRRRHLLGAGAALGIGAAMITPTRASAEDIGVDEVPALDQEDGGVQVAAADLTWYPMGEPEGRGWQTPTATRLTDRLPAHAESMVPATVWQRSRMSSGLYHRFRTDADAIAVGWTLPSSLVAADYLTRGSANGVDLYARDPEGVLRWASWGVPTAGGRTTKTISSGMVPADGLREYRLHLPLYNTTDDVQVGVPQGARFEIMPPDPTPPIVYYGTSIIHGAGASRPGMAIPHRLNRLLDRPVIGLGFSGVAKMEAEVAALLAEIDAAVYVVDCLPNMTPEQVAERTVPFVRRLRQDRPTTPILLVEERTRANSWIRAGWMDDHEARRKALRQAHRLLRASDPNLHLLPHRDMFGTDGEGTIDGSHATDLGSSRMLTVLQQALRTIL